MNTLLIIGASQNAMEDVDLFVQQFPTNFDCMAIGMDACKLPFTWSYIATYHPEEDIKGILSIMKKQSEPYKIIGHKQVPHVSIVVPFEKPSGSSALLGSLAAIRMGFSKIVLCGCPLQGVNDKKSPYEQFHKGWEAKTHEVKPFVRSMSGWTAEFLGKPTIEWMNQ